MLLIDTHTHLYLEEFKKDKIDVIKKAIASNVKKLILPNIDSTTIDDLLNTANAFPNNIFPLIGLHPTSVEEDYENEINIIKKYLKKIKFYGIGEIGLDFYWDTTFKDEQIKAFTKQLQIAEQNNLPAIIHTRNSFNETIEIVKQQKTKNLTGIFHCFTGNINQAKEIINLGFYIGIGGILTFKNSGLDKVLKNISLQNIVLETDAPYLAPVPKRGKRNESSYINYIAKKLAEIKNVSINEVADITSENAIKIFNI